MISKYNLNVFLSTLNFVLCFVGFQFATSLFLPAVSDMEDITRSVTVPYRAFALFLSLLVIMINILKKSNSYPIVLKVFLFFWGILVIRVFYDVFIRTDIRLGDTSQVWFYIFGICIPAVFSIIKSYTYINLEKSFWWVLVLTAVSLVLTLFSNQALLVGVDELNGRQGGNAAISTIAFGHFGTTSVILGLYTFLEKKLNWFYKVLIILLILLGFFSMLRAGSRGPVMALGVVLFFWLFSRVKNPFLAIFTLLIVGLFTVILMDQILLVMGDISPIMEERLRQSIYEGSTGGRDPYYSAAVEAFYDSPILGKQFVLIFPDGTFDYSHNLILDALMGLGVIGGGILFYFLGVAFKKSYYLIKKKDPHFWIGLLLIQQVMANMVSSAFYYNQLLSVLLVFVFLKYRRSLPFNYSR
jgi:O-antigen ligase